MKGLKDTLKNEKGVTVLLITLSLTAIIGFSALVIDAGLMFIERRKLVNALDAAALAGAQELPTDGYKAKEVAKDYAVKNGIPLEKINVIVNVSKTEITVEGNKEVDLLFAKILGIDKGNVTGKAKAIIGSVSRVYGGIRPLVVENQSLNYGQQVVLKEDAGDGESGNYGAVSLGGTGSSVFENNIKHGYNGELKVGDKIYTETGNMAGATYDGVNYIMDIDPSTFESFNKDSYRIWTIPIVDSLDVSGKDAVTIIGFASFFVEDVYKQSGQTQITGRFLRFTTNGDIDLSQTDYGLYGVKLIR